MAKSSLQAAFEGYLMEHGECDADTFKKLQSIFESKDDDDDKDDEETEKDTGDTDDDDDGLELDDDTKKVYADFKKLTEEQQKQFCQAQRTEKLYYEYAQLSEEDQQCISDCLGTDVKSYDVDTFLDIMESAIGAVNEVNAGTYMAESGDDVLDNFNFLK